jgi:hypothetical protein
MNILVLIKDLVLSTQIRTACEKAGHTYHSGRGNQKFEETIGSVKPEKVIIDLNIDGADPFKAIEHAKSSMPLENILCFYSHVNTELAEKAEEIGLKEAQIFRRSKFFTNLSTILA